jgi:hypothetical protein
MIKRFVGKKAILANSSVDTADSGSGAELTNLNQ